MKRKKKEFVDLEQKRYGLFMNERSFDLEIMYGRKYLENDVHFVIKLHRINLIKTKSHKLYGQSKPADKSFFPPVDINVMVNVDDGDQSFYGDGQGGIARDDSGNLRFGVYLSELKEKNTEINRGDIVEFNMSGEKNRFYEVEYANNVTDTTDKTIAGFKPYWRQVIAVPVRSDVVQFFRGGEKGD